MKTIPTELLELARDRKQAKLEADSAKKKLAAIDRELKPVLRELKQKGRGIPFSETREWAVKADGAPGSKHNVIWLYNKLLQHGYSESSVSTLFASVLASIDQKALEVLTTDAPHLRGIITKHAKPVKARAGSIYERERSGA